MSAFKLLDIPKDQHRYLLHGPALYGISKNGVPEALLDNELIKITDDDKTFDWMYTAKGVYYVNDIMDKIAHDQNKIEELSNTYICNYIPELIDIFVNNKFKGHVLRYQYNDFNEIIDVDPMYNGIDVHTVGVSKYTYTRRYYPSSNETESILIHPMIYWTSQLRRILSHVEGITDILLQHQKFILIYDMHSESDAYKKAMLQLTIDDDSYNTVDRWVTEKYKIDSINVIKQYAGITHIWPNTPIGADDEL